MKINSFSIVGSSLLMLAATACFGQSGAADPQYQSKGDVKRQYMFTDAGEMSKYRIYVPTTWTPQKQLPLVVILHGGGSDPDYVFDGGSDKAKYGGLLAANAEKHGFVIVAPTGYKNGSWGASYKPVPIQRPANAAPPAPPAGAANLPPRQPAAPVSAEETARINALAEKDAMNVIESVAKEYNVDRTRIYLMGNSMGEIGTLHFLQKYPTMWCAVGPSDGPIDPASYPYERAKGISGAVFVHGDNDTTAPIELNRQIAENFKKAGIETKFVEVPGGEHSTSWYMVMDQTFSFYDQHTCKK